MGQIRDAEIRAWQARAGLSEASGDRAELLRRMSDKAVALIRVIELERSGILDGDGHWSGSDAMGGTAIEMAALCAEWSGPACDFYHPIDNEGVTVEEHFGVCPHCHKTDGYLNAGKSHVFFCKEHKVSWNVGSNLFSSWREQTEEEQRQLWDEIGLETFERIEPYHPPGDSK